MLYLLCVAVAVGSLSWISISYIPRLGLGCLGHHRVDLCASHFEFVVRSPVYTRHGRTLILFVTRGILIITQPLLKPVSGMPRFGLLWCRLSPFVGPDWDRSSRLETAALNSLIEYLNSCHNGEFLKGVQAEVENRVLPLLNKDPKIGRKEVKDPIINVPKSPPDDCKLHKDPERHPRCSQCRDTLKWTRHFKSTVDEILYRFNRHDCSKGWCKNPRYPGCKARFPREVLKETTVDPITGYMKLKLSEANLNTYSNVLAYLMISNTDVTSFLTSTLMRAIIAYTTDYITKTGMRTHTMMEIVKSVFTRNTEFLQSVTSRTEKA